MEVLDAEGGGKLLRCLRSLAVIPMYLEALDPAVILEAA